MTFSLLPTYVAQSLTQITPEFLKSIGIRLLMLDFDNTIVPYTTDVPTPEMLAWLRRMQESEITLCVVSNSKKDRVVNFCRRYDIACITRAKKPFRKGIAQCLAQFGVPPEQCALAGDQIYTDTLGANCAGITPILVRAIHNHTVWLKLRHIAELPFIAAASGRKIENGK